VSWPPTLEDPRWFAAYFLLLWLTILIVLNLASGWWSLARDYRAQEPTEGQRIWFVSGQIGIHPLLSVSYGSCLILTLAPGGFRLALLFPFGLLSPPLFIPWPRVEQLEWVSAGLFAHQVRLRVQSHWPRISIRGHAGERLRDQYAAWLASNDGASVSPAAALWPHA
jgi:hypothetical protein